MHLPVNPLLTALAPMGVLRVLPLLGFVVGSVWSYTVGGTKLGDRVMALRWYCLEKGLQKQWNELFTFINRAIGGNITMSGGRTTFGEIDLAATGDVTTVVPRNYADPAGPNANVFRQMYGYPTGQVEEVLFEGFNG